MNDAVGGGGGGVRGRRGVILATVVAGLSALLLGRRRGLWVGEPLASSHCYKEVRTGNAELPLARCFEVTAEGRFGRVTEERDVAPAAHTLSPGSAVPGLLDGHGHLLQYGEFLHSVDLFGSASFDEVNRRIADYVDRSARPGLGGRHEWIRGVGWDQMALGGMPNAEMLGRDERLRGLYIMVDRVDVHCAWVSPAVLALLPDDLADVPGGEIVRQPGMGVFCDNAMDLVTALWPRPDKLRKKEFVRSAMKKLHEVGLVGMHDAGVVPEDMAMFAEMAASPTRVEDGWTLRVYAMLECVQRNTACLDEAARLWNATGIDDMLTIRSVKLFADGALGSWGSAMLEPYADRPDTSGSLLTSEQDLAAVVDAWAASGWQVNIHAIGDRANRAAVHAIAEALSHHCEEFNEHNPVDEGAGQASSGRASRQACQRDKFRFRIEHAQIIHPDDQALIRDLGIVPSIQPTHATSDMAYAEKRLGPERTASRAYRMRSLLTPRRGSSTNGPLVVGSDFPVEPPNPFQGIYAAVARKSPHTGRGADGSSGGWHLEEALSLDEAVAAFTAGVAYGAFMEGKAGVIREGAFADWVVLDRPIEEYGLDELRTLTVRETWVGGRRVYAREDVPPRRRFLWVW